MFLEKLEKFEIAQLYDLFRKKVVKLNISAVKNFSKKSCDFLSVQF